MVMGVQNRYHLRNCNRPAREEAMAKWVYTFGDGAAEGRADDKALLGGIDVVSALIGLYCIPVLIELVATPAAHLQASERVAGFRLGEALTLMAGLPNPGGLTPEALQAAAERDASLEEVLEVVRLFQFLLPELAVNVAIFRAQLGG